MRPLHVIGHSGMGDCIYQRPFVRWLTERRDVWLNTPWPEFYSDLEIQGFTGSYTKLRTQQKNMARHEFTDPPPDAEELGLGYRLRNIKRGHTCLTAMKSCVPGFEDAAFRFDLPDPPQTLVLPREYAVVRPVTHRTDWPAPGRSPDPAYMDHAVAELQRIGITVMSVADLEEGKEWRLDSYTPDIAIHDGSAAPEALMEMVAGATLTLGPVGWLLPMSMAYRVPHIVIQGGFGFMNRPEVLMEPYLADLRVWWLQPDPFCQCKSKGHDCNKRIPEFEAKFGAALEACVGTAVAA